MYQIFNNFIKEFFQCRYDAVENKKKEKLYEDLKMINESTKTKELNAIIKKIKINKKSLFLYLENCKNYKLPCVHKYGHK